ncbi:cytosine permease [Pseudochrobactrum sp. sp1633]|uniref:cytosine permease n=1 Tax=Pseudochrobactrum sp. sp1633 TaxID=3036706 RepID=UPI0025A5C442|nr:cytosine permease [Pseudochrobactrum sp. sp1633]MDM8347168.1 cytosine permease [Pseudochrobactrum sp. sp1633]
MSDIGIRSSIPHAASATFEADKSALPLLLSERTWGAWKLFFSLATVAAATWCYIIGEYVGYYLDFKQSFTTLVGGSMLGILLVILALVPVCMRYGIDSIAASKPQFGTKGWIVPFTLQYLSIVGWNCLLLIFFGKSLINFLIAAGALAPGDHRWLMSCATLLACSISFTVLLKGASGVDRIAKILVIHVVVGLWMLWLIVDTRWNELMTAVPQYASDKPLWNYTTGIELAIAPALSWWPYFGAMVRMSPNGKTAVPPAMIGFGLVVGLLSMIGAAGILALKISDPAEWMRAVGGETYAIIALAFVTAANLGTAVAGIYASSIGLRHYKKLEAAPWWLLLGISIAPVATVGVFVPDLFFNNFGTFLALIAVTFAPLCGIQIADYFILRKGKVSITAIYDRSPKNEYRYWSGFNPAAILAMVVGVGTYLSLLNPLTYTSSSLYQYTTASLPSALAAGIAFVMLTKLFVQPAKRGGY